MGLMDRYSACLGKPEGLGSRSGVRAGVWPDRSRAGSGVAVFIGWCRKLTEHLYVPSVLCWWRFSREKIQRYMDMGGSGLRRMMAAKTCHSRLSTGWRPWKASSGTPAKSEGLRMRKTDAVTLGPGRKPENQSWSPKAAGQSLSQLSEEKTLFTFCNCSFGFWKVRGCPPL